ncbi:hypothetical protein [Microlunatus ginsengisoli]|uniref:Putative RNase-like toxin toxin1 domain-containing protein n=1 Tax=Microlunatus ginsengisoli TaxID=363863 RepID=A0ABP7A9X4_9ACTN
MYVSATDRRYPADPARPVRPPPPRAESTGAALLHLQRSAGNAAVARLVVQRCGGEVHDGCPCQDGKDDDAEGPVQRSVGPAADRPAATTWPAAVQRVPGSYDAAEQKKLITEALRDKDIGKVKSIDDGAYTLADDSQAIDLIMILLNQGWVGPRDENAIYQIWKSRGKGVLDLATKYTYVWNMCLSRDVTTIWDLPDLAPVKNEFKQAVAARARGYLDANTKTVATEQARYGLDDGSAAPTDQQGRERERLMVAAGEVQKARDAIKTMDRMLVGYNHVTGTPTASRTQRCAAMFNPEMPPPLPGHAPTPAAEDAVLPSWDDTHKNYERANALIQHHTRQYPALVALREDTELNDVAKLGVSSELPANQLTSMQIVKQALATTKANIDKTYPLLSDAKKEFALELQPIHEQLFLSDPTWQQPFRRLVAQRAVKEHDNVEFWNTMALPAVGMALIVVAEIASGGLATFFFAAAAAGSIAQAAESWDKYFTLKAASETHLSAETELLTRDRASEQLLTAALDTVMAFVDAYSAAKGGIDAVAKARNAEAKLGSALGKEATVAAAEAKASRVGVGAGHEVAATRRGIERCSPEPCPLIGTFWENTLERHPDVKGRLEKDAALARTDPVYAARDAAAADQSLQNITQLEVELWAAAMPTAMTRGEVKFTRIKRLPEARADIANKTLTAEDLAVVEKNVAEMKADGRLAADYVFTPKAAVGAVVPLDQAVKAMEIIGVKMSANSAVAECWRIAAEAARGGAELTAENYVKFYDSARGRFWRLLGKDEHAAAKKFFTDHGFTIDGSGAAYLDVGGVHAQEVSLGLDHMLPKATGDNYAHALDAEHLQFLMQADNTKLSHLEKGKPSLRR